MWGGRRRGGRCGQLAMRECTFTKAAPAARLEAICSSGPFSCRGLVPLPCLGAESCSCSISQRCRWLLAAACAMPRQLAPSPGVTMCFSCRQPLTAADRASPLYTFEVSCPYCLGRPEGKARRFHTTQPSSTSAGGGDDSSSSKISSSISEKDPKRARTSRALGGVSGEESGVAEAAAASVN